MVFLYLTLKNCLVWTRKKDIFVDVIFHYEKEKKEVEINTTR